VRGAEAAGDFVVLAAHRLRRGVKGWRDVSLRNW